MHDRNLQGGTFPRQCIAPTGGGIGARMASVGYPADGEPTRTVPQSALGSRDLRRRAGGENLAFGREGYPDPARLPPTRPATEF